MHIKYLAHSAFLVTTEAGVRVLFDPYQSGGFGGALKYGPIREPADVVVTSHRHADHGHTVGLAGKHTVIDGLQLAEQGPRSVAGVSLCAVHTYHDQNKGRDRGENAVIILEADGLRVCHCGDLGHVLTPAQVEGAGRVDVLLLPVGGHFTIDAAEATQVMQQLQPRITIPMHFKTPKVDFPIAPVEKFLAGKTNVRRPGGSELQVTAGSLPSAPEIVVLDPSL